METGRVECLGVADGSFGGGTYKGAGGDGQGGDRDGNILSQWEDNVVNLTLGKEPNYPLAYNMGLEHHH